MKLNEMADAVIAQLAAVATAPGPVTYLNQASLMLAAGVTRDRTFDDVLTRAAIRVELTYPGYAIGYNPRDGYRLLDDISVRDLRYERGRLRGARTKLRRTAVTLGAARNGPVLKMVATQVQAVVTTVIDPALASLDTIIG